MDLNGITLENFQKRTGQRFRMNKAAKSRGLSREAAFAEWLSSQGPIKESAPVDLNKFIEKPTADDFIVKEPEDVVELARPKESPMKVAPAPNIVNPQFSPINPIRDYTEHKEKCELPKCQIKGYADHIWRNRPIHYVHFSELDLKEITIALGERYQDEYMSVKPEDLNV